MSTAPDAQAANLQMGARAAEIGALAEDFAALIDEFEAAIGEGQVPPAFAERLNRLRKTAERLLAP